MTGHVGPALTALGVYVGVGLVLALLLSRRGEDRATALCALACWPWMLGLIHGRRAQASGPMSARILAFFESIEGRVGQGRVLSQGGFPELAAVREALLRADRRLALVDEILGEEERARCGVDTSALREARRCVALEIEQVLLGLRQLRIQYGLLALCEVQDAMGEDLCVRLRDIEARVHALEELGATIGEARHPASMRLKDGCPGALRSSRSSHTVSTPSSPSRSQRMAAPHVLIVDDDPHLREMLRYALGREGLRVSEAADGHKVLAALAADPADLIVLDVLMPEMDGLDLCRRLRAGGSASEESVRAATSTVPIIFLSSKGDEFDRVLGLELGGDDYLAKPFSVRELVSRVRAVLRRARPSESPLEPAGEQALSVGLLRLEPARHRCFAGEREVGLTVTELRLLRVLMGRPGRVFTREELTERAWDEPHFIADRTVDSHIRRIRQKLREAGLDPIETVHGLGFRVVSP